MTDGMEERVKCRGCGGAAPPADRCPECKRLQPFPPGADHWAILGVPPRLAVDRAALAGRVHELNRRFHPDYYRLRSPEEQAQSLENSAAVNTAYRTLRDPVSRAEYVLSQEGLGVREAAAVKPPADLLAEILEIQEARQELTAGGRESPALRARLRAAQADLEARRGATEGALAGLFAGADAAGADDRRRILREMRNLLGRRAYLRTVLRDLEGALNGGDGTEGRADR